MQADPHMDGYLALIYSSRGDERQLYIMYSDSLMSSWDYRIRGDIIVHEEERDGFPFVWWTSTTVCADFSSLIVKLIGAHFPL